VQIPGPGGEYWIVDLDERVPRRITLPSVAMDQLWLLPDGEHVIYRLWLPGEADVWLLEIEEGR